MLKKTTVRFENPKRFSPLPNSDILKIFKNHVSSFKQFLTSLFITKCNESVESYRKKCQKMNNFAIMNERGRLIKLSLSCQPCAE